MPRDSLNIPTSSPLLLPTLPAEVQLFYQLFSKPSKDPQATVTVFSLYNGDSICH